MNSIKGLILKDFKTCGKTNKKTGKPEFITPSQIDKNKRLYLTR